MNISDIRNKASVGDVASQTILGICYLDGIDVEVDFHEALLLLSAPAARGVPRAMTNLARIYSQGLGVAKDIPEAIRLYEAAAKAGEFSAQIALGRIYLCGTEIPANPVAARFWYALALAQNDNVVDCPEIMEAKAFVDAGSRGLGNR
jgi:TPR repeat protein